MYVVSLLRVVVSPYSFCILVCVVFTLCGYLIIKLSFPFLLCGDPILFTTGSHWPEVVQLAGTCWTTRTCCGTLQPCESRDVMKGCLMLLLLWPYARFFSGCSGSFRAILEQYQPTNQPNRHHWSGVYSTLSRVRLPDEACNFYVNNPYRQRLLLRVSGNFWNNFTRGVFISKACG